MTIATAPNAALPVTAAWRDKAKRALQAKDMTPEGWQQLVAGLVEFFEEEAEEPEHASDAQPKTLYVHRPLKNGEEVAAWAHKAGFAKTLKPDDMHVTLAFSKESVDWSKLRQDDEDWHLDAGTTRSVKALGDKGAVVLRFKESAFDNRWKQFKDAGASWDFPSFQPHVTITYEGGDVDLSNVKPYDGPLEFGPEVFGEIDTDWADKVEHASDATLAFDRDSVREIDPDGRMHVAVTNISKATVNPYKGSEIPGWQKLGLDADKIYQLLRDPEELKKAVKSANGVPVLRKHVPVNAEDHKPMDVVGALGNDAEFVEPFLRNSMTIWAAGDIALIKSGDKKELSMGYRYVPDMTAGNFRGISYDGVMRSISVNHVAIVEDGRAGPDVVVGDSAMKMATDPSVSEAQHRAMEAAAHGKSNLGIPKKVGKEFVSKDKSKAKDEGTMTEKAKAEDKRASDAFPKSAMDWLKGNMDEKKFEEFSAKDEWPDEKAEDSEEEEAEEVTEGRNDVKEKAEDKKGAKDKKMGKDKKAKDKAMDEDEPEKKADKAEDKARDGAMDKPAMDEAIKRACEATAKSVRENMQALHEAATEVKPYIGEVNAMAFDSGDAIKRHALKSLGVKDADKLHASALSTVLGYQRKVGAHPIESHRKGGEMAMDSSTRADAIKMAPGLANIRIGA